MLIEGVSITADFDCAPAELANYVAYVKERDRVKHDPII